MAGSIQPMDLVNNKLVFAALALGTHYVIHSAEWDNCFHIILGVGTLVFSGCAAAEYAFDARAKSIGAAIRLTAATAIVYLAVLWTSILLHRGFFHRLRNVCAANLISAGNIS